MQEKALNNENSSLINLSKTQKMTRTTQENFVITKLG